MREAQVFGSEPKENSVVVKLWGGGKLSFNPNSHAPIFSIVALMAILIAMIILAIVGIWIPKDATWMEKLTSALGYGVTGIIGANGGHCCGNERQR